MQGILVRFANQKNIPEKVFLQNIAEKCIVDPVITSFYPFVPIKSVVPSESDNFNKLFFSPLQLTELDLS